MDNPRKLIVGYDLCEDYSQISRYSYKTFEPRYARLRMRRIYDSDCSCQRSDTGIWLYGNEAISVQRKVQGLLPINYYISLSTKKR